MYRINQTDQLLTAVSAIFGRVPVKTKLKAAALLCSPPAPPPTPAVKVSGAENVVCEGKMSSGIILI